jgi:hypothetical protein
MLRICIKQGKGLFYQKKQGGKMTTKEKIKKRIDLLPDELLDRVQTYLDSIKPQLKNKRKIYTLHLKGQYDNINVRQKAYE